MVGDPMGAIRESALRAKILQLEIYNRKVEKKVGKYLFSLFPTACLFQLDVIF